MKIEFRLNPVEVVQSGGGGTSEGRKGQLTKQSRASGLTSYEIELTHLPTGVKAKGVVPADHYSRQEMIRQRQQLKEKLFKELEEKVPAFLRLPGR